jgi:septal ring factor EnvC (AmiA/AmiB activator)
MNKLNEARVQQMKIYRNTQEEINQIFESVAKNRSESQEKLFNQFSS